MITRHRNQALIGAGLFGFVVLACITVSVLTAAEEGEAFDDTNPIPLIIFWGTTVGVILSLLWTCYHLAKGKGHSSALVIFGIFPCFLPIVLTMLLALPDKNPKPGARRKKPSTTRPGESVLSRLVRYRRNALIGNVFGLFLVLVGIATIYFPVGIFEDFENETLFGFLIFVCGYIGVLWGCRWWLMAKGWAEELIFIGLLPLTVCLIPYVREIIFIEPDFLPLSMFMMTLILLVVVLTLPNRSARTTRHRHAPLPWAAPTENPSAPVKTIPAGDATQILPVAAEHLPALAKLAGVIWRQHYPGIISLNQINYMLGKMYSLETLQQELLEKRIHFVRLLTGERFVGFASYGPTAEPGVMKLHKCYLLPELHGRGYGSQLLQHCEREVRQLGARRLILAVNKHNAKAVAAYQRNGFTIAESVVTDFGNGFVMDDYIMAKNLPPNAARAGDAN